MQKQQKYTKKTYLEIEAEFFTNIMQSEQKDAPFTQKIKAKISPKKDKREINSQQRNERGD